MDDFAELMERYSRCAALVRGALDAVPSGKMNIPGSEGWSIRDVVVHLTDAEIVRATRFRLLLVDRNPPLFDFDQDRWRERLAYGSRDASLAFATYEAMTASSCELLRVTGPGTLERTGCHATDGQISVRDLLLRGIAHAGDHAAQIEALAR